MTRRYVLAYLAVFVALTGWYTMAGAQQPVPEAAPIAPPVLAPVESKPLTSAPAIVDYSQPIGRQEPCVQLEWTGSKSVRVGQTHDFALHVRNVSTIPVQQVLVRSRIPQGWSFASAEPKTVMEEAVLLWEIGTLLPKQEQIVHVRMVPNQPGDFSAQAWVTFTGAAAMRIKASEPKLQVKTSGPQQCVSGDSGAFDVTVSNVSDCPVEHVKLAATMSAGLDHARGKQVEFELGNLMAGETRTIQVLFTASRAGDQMCRTVCTADGGVSATSEAWLKVAAPRLDVAVEGPKMRYLDRKANYVVKVTNSGNAPAGNVMVSDALPAGFKYLGSTGGRYDPETRTVAWFAGELAPGQVREFGVEAMLNCAGEFTQRVQAVAAGGIKAGAELTTAVDGLSAIQLEVGDLQDPIEVGGETTYEIRMTNTGTKTETDLRLSCTMPDKMQFKSATGPSEYTQEGAEISFAPLSALAPRAGAIYRVTVKALSPGVAQFKSRITSAVLVEPVHKDEATRIYTD